MIDLSPTHLTIAGVVILLAVGGALLWWVARAAMGWHSGRALYWLNSARDEDADDEDHEDDDSGVSPQ